MGATRRSTGYKASYDRRQEAYDRNGWLLAVAKGTKGRKQQTGCERSLEMFQRNGRLLNACGITNFVILLSSVVENHFTTLASRYKRTAKRLRERNKPNRRDR